MDTFDIEKLSIQWVAKKLSKDEEEKHLENLATRIILAYQELAHKKKSRKNEIFQEFTQSPEEYLGVE